MLFCLACLSFCNSIRQKHIKVPADSTTAVFTINKMGSHKSLQCDLGAQTIWSWAIKIDIFTTAVHVPGVFNTRN